MNKKKLKVISVILAFLLCFPLHFLYEKFPCFLTSVFAPVNESIWEHMKILFGSILLAGVAQKIFCKIKHENINNICFSNFVGAITSIPIFLAFYLPIYSFLGHNMFLTLVIMFLTICIAEWISYLLMNKEEFKFENLTIFFVLLVYIGFTILTYSPPKGSLFIDPETQKYGIKK